MEENLIREKIYEIRGYRIILDFYLAKLYDVATKRLNEQVKSNNKRFPDDFMFRLTKSEWDAGRSNATKSWSQFATSSDNELNPNSVPERKTVR